MYLYVLSHFQSINVIKGAKCQVLGENLKNIKGALCQIGEEIQTQIYSFFSMTK